MTCGCSRHATLGWHMKFVASIYPGWDAQYAKTLVKRFNLRPEQNVQRPVER